MRWYDYDAQVWVTDGLVEPCGHKPGRVVCTACDCAGQPIHLLRRAVVEAGHPMVCPESARLAKVAQNRLGVLA